MNEKIHSKEHSTEYVNFFLGRAFPIALPRGKNQPDFDVAGGLSKRELFAAMAMQGLASGVDEDGDPDMMATFAVACADALIERLKDKAQ